MADLDASRWKAIADEPYVEPTEESKWKAIADEPYSDTPVEPEHPVSRTQRVMDAVTSGIGAAKNSIDGYAKAADRLPGNIASNVGADYRVMGNSVAQANADHEAEVMRSTAENFRKQAKEHRASPSKVSDFIMGSADDLDKAAASLDAKAAEYEASSASHAKRATVARADALASMPKDAGPIEQTVQGAATGLADLVPPLAASLVPGGLPVAAGMMGYTGYAGYRSKLIEAGVPQDKAEASATRIGALDAATFMVPAGRLLKNAPGLVSHAVNFLATAVPASEADALGHILEDYGNNLDPEMTVDKALEQLKQTAIQTIAGGIPLVGGAHVLQTRARAAQDRAAAASGGEKAMDYGFKPVDIPPEPAPPSGFIEAPKPPAGNLDAPKPTGKYAVDEAGNARELSQNDLNDAAAARAERESLGTDNITRVPTEEGAAPAVQEPAPNSAAARRAKIEAARQAMRDSVHEDAKPEDISVAKSEDGQGWTIYVGDEPHVTYTSETLARDEARAVRGELKDRPQNQVKVLGETVTKPQDPTPAQAEAGNYRKPTVNWKGLDIKVENTKGTTRSGVDEAGTPWSSELHSDYGYFKGTKSTDGEGVDVYMGPHRGVKTAYVVDQLKPNGIEHDEPKVVIGARNEDEAKTLYKKHYPKGWKGMGAVTPMPVEALKDWLKNGDTTKPVQWTPPKPKAPPSERSTRVASAKHDSILEYLSKMRLHGADTAGLNLSDMASEGLDPREMATAAGHGINRPFTKGGGSLDHAAEILTEAGYPVGGDKNKLLDLITAEIRNGKKTYAGERGAQAEMERAAAKHQEMPPADVLPEDVSHLSDEELAALEKKLDRTQNAIEAKRELDARQALSGSKPQTVDEQISKLHGKFSTISEDQYDNDPLFARRDDVTTDMFNAPASREEAKPVEKKAAPTHTNDMFGSAPVMKEAPKPVDAKKEPEAPAQKMMSADDRIRNARGLTMERLRAYDADEAVTKLGDKWSFTTYYGNGSPGVFGTKREALVAARAHIDLLTDIYEKPSDYANVISELANARLKLYEKYKYTIGATEAEIWARINKEIPDEIPDEPEAKMPEPIPEKPKADEAPLSKIIDKVNDKHGGELGYADRIMTIAFHKDLFTRLREGKASLEEFKGSWEALKKSESMLLAELEKMTKPQLIELSRTYRPNENKAHQVSEALSSMQTSFALGQGVSFQLGGGGYKESQKKAIDELVEATTQEQLDTYAGEAQARLAEHAEKMAGFEDPKTLEDFQNFIRYKGEKKLTDEQMERFDALMADESIQKLKDAKEKRARERATVQSAGQTVGAKVIPAKHTKHGYDIFVVQMGERVERDVYDKLNTAAKQLGGYYSSYRGGGAIPGFTFKDAGQAQSFAALLETGDTAAASEAVQERRDDYKDDKSQSTIERLRSMADRLDESAQERLNQDRKTNTSRRAGMAARAEQQARGDMSFALTMRNIAQSIEDGKAKFLEGVRTKVQIEMLYGFLNRARYNEANARAKIDNGESSWVSESNRLKYMDQPPTAATARHVDYPYYWIQTGDLASLGRSLVEIDGAKQLGDSIVKKMDDISKEYTAFVKDNLHAVTLFTNNGNRAVFDSKAEAERIRLLSPSSQKMVVVSLGRGKNHVVLNPREAIARKLWEGPPEKRIRLNPDMAIEIMDKVDRHNSKAANRFKQVHYPYMFSHAKEERARLEAMGIVNPSMLREAMREFIALRTEPAKADPIKALMRALVGRKDVGIDFFPTPPEEAANVIAKAGIEPGMDVLDAGAGYGALADEARAVGVEPDVVEMSSTLVEILEAKGYEVVGRDFMDYSGKQYDRIVMNPPFSNGRDIDFVRHAYDNLLKPGGRIVSIMGEGVFFRQDAKATAFREFADSIGAYDEQLPAGTFLDPSLPVTTGANARVIVIDKPKGEIDTPLSFRSETSGGAVTEKSVRDEVNNVLRGFAVRPKMMVAGTFDQLPKPLLEGLKRRGVTSQADAGGTQAIYWKGGIYFIADQFANLSSVRQAVLHESVIHFGLDTLLDKGVKNEIIDGIAKAMPMETMRHGVREYGKPQRDANGAHTGGYNHANERQRRLAAEEVLAYYGQKYLDKETIPARIKRLIEKWFAAIRDAVSRLFGAAQKFDTAFMKKVVQDLQAHLKSGEALSKYDYLSGNENSANESEPMASTKAPVYYSALTRAVETAKREKGTANEWLSTLRNMPGIKEDEIQWTGLADWINGLDHRATKQEVAEFLHANQIEVKDVLKGAAEPGELSKTAEMQRQLDQKIVELTAHGYTPQFDDYGNEELVAITHNKSADMYEYDPETESWKGEYGEVPVLPDAVAKIAKEIGLLKEQITNAPREDDIPTNATRYGQYALPGGKNYRELLLTLPNEFSANDLSKRKDIYEKYQDRLDTLHNVIGDYSKEISVRNKASSDMLSLMKERDDLANTAAPEKTPYKSSHWNEPNILAHVRFDERIDSGGKRVLHIAEIQSDWAQTARKRGFKDEANGLTQAEKDELRNVLDRAGADLADLTPEQRARRTELIGRSNQKYDGVPRGPFVGNTESWSTLAMRRMVRWAAENGFDRITWDTGATNAERYDLSKQIDTIKWTRNTDRTHNFRAIKDGRDIIAKTQMNDSALAETIGKDVAEKIISDPNEGGKLSGLDLRVGDSGMTGFYDKILPATVNKLVKKWGGKVTASDIGVPMPTEQRSLAAFIDWMQERGDTRERGSIGSEFRDGPNSPNVREFMKVRDVSTPVHSLDITPQMRDAAMEGQPLFARREGSMDRDIPGAAPPKETEDEVTATTGDGGKGPYDRARRAVLAIPNSELVMSFRRLIDPVNVSAVSKETAVIGRKALGELTWGTQHAQEQLEQYSRLIEQLSPKDKLDMIDAIEGGKEQKFSALQPAANAMRQMLDGWRDKVRSLGEGHLDNYIENYFPHAWQDEKAASKIMAAFGRRPLRGPATFLKQRTVPTVREGIARGLKPLTLNPLASTLFKIREMQRFYTGVKLMQEFKERGLARFLPSGKTMPDGWVEINDAVGKVRQWSEAEKGFIERGRYIMPEDAGRLINNHLSASKLRNFAPAQWIRVGSNALNALQLGFSGFHIGFTTLDVLISKNALGIERLMHGEPLRAAAAFGETFLGPVSAGMNLRRGYKLLQAYLDPAGATPELKAQVLGLIAAGGRPKMDAYFLPTQIENPFRGVGPGTLAKDVRDAILKPHGKVAAVSKAMTDFAPQYATKVWSELQEMGKLYPKWQLPFEVAGRITRASTSLIMEHIVPLQKLGVFSDLAADYIRRNPMATPEESAREMQKIWTSVDNRLGEMVYDRLFWDRTFKDAMHMTFRAVGWNYGTVNEISGAGVDVLKLIDQKIREGKLIGNIPADQAGKGAKLLPGPDGQLYEAVKNNEGVWELRTKRLTADDFGHKIPYVIAMTMTTALIGATLKYLFTGSGPDELKDYFFPPTGGRTKYGTPERLSLPSYAKDVYEYSQEPGQTVINKLNPIYSLVHQVWTNEDYFGQGIYDPASPKYSLERTKQIGKFMVEAATPFSFQKGNKMQGADDGTALGTLKTVLPKIGVNVAPGRVSSPDQIERARHVREEQGYINGLMFKMKKARADGDTERATELQQQIMQARKNMAEDRREVGKDKQKGHQSQKTGSLAPLFNIMDGKDKISIVQNLKDAGHSALADLIQSIPDKPRPIVARALQQDMRVAS